MPVLNREDYSLNIPATTKPRVVIVGGGFGGVNLAKDLAGHAYQVVLFSRVNYHGFWPLLYQVATAGIEPEAIAEPLRKVFGRGFENKDLHFRPLRVLGIDPVLQTVSTLLGELPYDHLVLATGSKANYFGNEQIKKYAFPLKQITHALNLRSQLLQSFEQANLTRNEEVRQRLLNVVIVGGGPTGVEVAGALAEMRKNVLPKDYPGMDYSKMNIYLVDGNDRVLPPMSEKSSAQSQRDLENLGIILKLGTVVESYDGECATLKNGEQISTNTLVWAAGVTGALVPGLPDDTVEKGRYKVNEFNQVLGYENIYALGDIALMRTAKYPHGHPGVAQPAIQQGQHLAKNLLRRLRGELLEPFHYFDKGSLAIIGRYRAVADLPGNLHWRGLLAWLAWLFVHVFYLLGGRSRLVVLSNWAYQFFTYQSGTRVIINPYVRPADRAGREFIKRQEMDS